MIRAIFKKVSLCSAAQAWLALLLLLSAWTPFDSTPFKTSPTAEKTEQNEKLQAEADALLPLFDEMPPVTVSITDAPVLKSGSSIETGVAYTICEKKNQPDIFVKKVFYEKANRKQIVNILKHELTHAWQCRGEMMWGHDARFRKKFEEVGGFGN
jgi:hypothetical protein